MTWGEHAWDGEGTAAVTPDALLLVPAAGDRRHAARDGIVAAVCSGRLLWLRRRDRRDLLLEFRRADDAERLHEALAAPSPDVAPIVGARWRKLLAAEAGHARRGWFSKRTPAGTVRKLDRGPWDGPGDVRVSPDELLFTFRDGRTRHTSRRTVRDVVHDGRLVWVQRRHAHDWLVRCRSEADAERLEQRLRA